MTGIFLLKTLRTFLSMQLITTSISHTTKRPEELGNKTLSLKNHVIWPLGHQHERSTGSVRQVSIADEDVWPLDHQHERSTGSVRQVSIADEDVPTTRQDAQATWESNRRSVPNEHLVIQERLLDAAEDRERHVLVIDSDTCADETRSAFLGVEGRILIIGRKLAYIVQCEWDIRAPAGHFLTITTEKYTLPCDVGSLIIRDDPDNDKIDCEYDFCIPELRPPPVLNAISNHVHFKMYFDAFDEEETILLGFSNSPYQPPHMRLVVNLKSPLSGFVTSPGYGEKPEISHCVRDSYTLHVPEDHVAIVSFLDFQWFADGKRSYRPIPTTLSSKEPHISVFEVNAENGSHTLLWQGANNIPPTRIYNTSVSFRFYRRLQRLGSHASFKLAFSLLNASTAPKQLVDGKFDCTNATDPSFRQHLDCNFVAECDRGQDEISCPNSADECNGTLRLGGKCYDVTVLNASRELSWNQAERICKERGWNLVTIKTQTDWDAFQTLLARRKSVRDVFIGLRTAPFSIPVYYRFTWQWVDNTTNYFSLPFDNAPFIVSASQTCFEAITMTGNVHPLECAKQTYCDVFCEKVLRTASSEGVSLVKHTVQWSNRGLIKIAFCADGHVTHDFLACDPSGNCGREQFASACEEERTVFRVFFCVDGQPISYTLVCDHHFDCRDNSDETFCVHAPCRTACLANEQCSLESRCDSGQCIPIHSLCNGHQDCRDGSDENKCAVSRRVHNATINQTSRSKVTFNDVGSVTSVPLEAPSFQCPETHFQCPDSYCLPVYLRCNDVYDCPGWEDEADCSTYTCPGFYRCRNSAVCLHADHLCDGVFQCPRHDDELVCGLSCPEGCQCQGLAFVCATPFPVKDHGQVRYVDASGSHMVPQDFVHNHYLVYLRLSRCGVYTMENLTMPNLAILDLSDNLISTVATVLGLSNLRQLYLSNNPITTLIGTSGQTSPSGLEIIDLSITLIAEFSESALSNFPHLRSLNLSFSGLKSFSADTFWYNSDLEVLDVRGTDLETFPGDLLKGLTRLKTVYSKNYRLCCRSTLPSQFNPSNCFAPRDEISSCEDLLRSDLYRLFLWLFVSLSTAGNAGSLIFRVFIQRLAARAGYHVFVTNLSASDLLMGVYLIILGLADHAYRGSYLWHDLAWKLSAVCKTAGFVCFVSNEVSALIIFLITLDRFIAFRFPLGGPRFQRKSALMACGLVWVVGLLFAAIPLLPVTSHWEYYSQTGICIPLPVTRINFKGRYYSFGVMIVFNLVIFLMIAVGQASIYWSVRVNSMRGDSASTSKKTQDATIARRLITVALSDFLCWFPIGLLGVLASLGVPISGEVNVGMAIFVLPVNSALNPFLYTLNTILEKRRKAKKAERMKRLEEEIINKMRISASDLC